MIYDLDMCETRDCDPTAELIRLVREEADQLLRSGNNWKLTVNGSAGGDVRVVTEVYRTVRKADHWLVRSDSIPQ